MAVGRRLLTKEEFVAKMKDINSNIEVVGEYVNYRTKIKCRCKKDGHEWEAIPNALGEGSGCPKCAGRIKKTHEQFIEELSDINPNIEILSKYQGAQDKIKCKCRVCEHLWDGIPAHLLRKVGCKMCAPNRPKI